MGGLRKSICASKHILSLEAMREAQSDLCQLIRCFNITLLYHFALPLFRMSKNRKLTHIKLQVFAHRAYDPQSVAIRYGNYAEGGPEVNDTKVQHKNDAEDQFLKNFSTQGFGKAYSDILEKGAESSYRTILLHIANNPDKPLIIHCVSSISEGYFPFKVDS